MRHAEVAYEHVRRAEDYVEAVLSGAETAGELERLACERHRRDVTEADAGGPWRFDAASGERACRFIATLPHVKGEWAKRRERIRLEGWQCFVLASLFGWVDRHTGLRRYRNGYLEVARKNAKSTILAGVGLYLLALDGEAGAEIYSAATTRDQAKITFQMARAMAQASAEYRTRAQVSVLTHEITQPPSHSAFKALATQTHSLDGLNPHGALVDELHAHQSREVMDVLRSGMGAREQPMLLAITTAGANISGVGYEERAYLEKVLRGVLDDPTLFGVIYAIDEGDDPFDPNVWRKANPNLGVSVKPHYLEAEARKAVATPTQRGEFLRKHCCRWSAAGVSAIDLNAWRRGADKTVTLSRIAACETRLIGLDGSKSDDITSIAALGYEGDVLLIWDEHFGTSDLIRVPGSEHLATWCDDGWMIECHGSLINLEDVEARLREIATTVAPEEIAYDPLYLLQMAQRLSSDFVMVEQKQNIMSLDPALRTFQGLVRDGKVRHRGSPLLDWMVSNARAKPAGEFLKLFKQAGHMKIDGVQAVCTGLARLQAPADARMAPTVFGDDYRISA